MKVLIFMTEIQIVALIELNKVTSAHSSKKAGAFALLGSSVFVLMLQ